MFENRKARRARIGGSKKGAAIAGATVAAAALTAGLATPVAAPAQMSVEDVRLLASSEVPTYVVGPLLSLAAGLGLLNVTLPLPGNLGFTLEPVTAVGSDPKRIYDAINTAAPTPNNGPGGICEFGGDPCRLVPLLADASGTATVRALNAMWSSAAGETPDGYTPFDKTTTTSLVSVLINNSLRPNGGILSRFAPLLNPLGVDTSPVKAGVLPLGAGPTFQSGVIDLTWAYNPAADFPVTLNPFSLMNSALAGLPPASFWSAAAGVGDGIDGFTRLIDQFNQAQFFNPNSQDIAPTVIGTRPRENALTSGLGVDFVYPGIPSLIVADDFYPFKGFTFTYETAGWWRQVIGTNTKLLPTPWAVDRLPLLTLMDIPSNLVNSVLTAIKSPYLLGSPLADILEPAAKILVNIGYPDVITPADIASKPDLALQPTEGPPPNGGGGYRPYDRAFGDVDSPGELKKPSPLDAVPFGWFNNPGMTAEQTAAVPGDVWNAFTGAIKAQFEKPLWGILVPNPAIPPTPPTAAKVAAAPAPAAVAAPAPVVQSAPVLNGPQAPEPTAAPAPAAVAAPAPLVQSAPTLDEPQADDAAPVSVALDNDTAQDAAPVPRTSAVPGDHSDDDTGRAGGKNRRGAR